MKLNPKDNKELIPFVIDYYFYYGDADLSVYENVEVYQGDLSHVNKIIRIYDFNVRNDKMPPKVN